MSFSDKLRTMVPPDRKDWALVAFGAMALFVAYAYGAVTVPSSARGPISSATAVIPLRVMAAVWAVGGTYCIVTAFSDRKLGGWAVAGFMPAGWGGLYLACFLHGDPGRGWVTAGIFWCFSLFIGLCALLVDPHALVRRRS